jgi:hypothetical protein
MRFWEGPNLFLTRGNILFNPTHFKPHSMLWPDLSPGTLIGTRRKASHPLPGIAAGPQFFLDFPDCMALYNIRIIDGYL